MKKFMNQSKLRSNVHLHVCTNMLISLTEIRNLNSHDEFALVRFSFRTRFDFRKFIISSDSKWSYP